MKYEVRVRANITFDFEVEAMNAKAAEIQVLKLLPYIEHGKLENQPVSVKCGKGQRLTSLFIMDIECDDVNESDQ